MVDRSSLNIANDDIERYSSMDETELDEESINWVQLIARIISVVLLIAIVVFFAMGFLKNQKLLILAAIVAGILVLVFVCTFGCSENARKYCVSKYKNEFRMTDSSIQTIKNPILPSGPGNV